MGVEPLGEVVTFAEPARNVIVLLIDTLRASKLKVYNPQSRVRTPALDAFAAESVVFENAQVQSAWTLPSLASLMTSLYSSTHGAWTFDSRLGESFTTLAERLAKIHLAHWSRADLAGGGGAI